MTAYS